MRRFLALTLLTLAACSDTPEGSQPLDAGADAELPQWTGWPECDETAATQRITFVHANDLHATYTPVNGVSPWSRVRGFYELVRRQSPYTVFTNGGDDHEKGSVAELLSGGLSTIEMVQGMEFDLRVIGNHDFAWSLEELLAFTHDEHSDVLLSNVSYTGESPELFEAVPFVVKQIGCLRVGFGGLVSMPWDERDVEIPENFYPELAGDYDYVAQAQALVDAHRSEVDLFVLLNHVGLGDDATIAMQVPGIDIILSGHSHTLTGSPVVAGETLIVQSGAFAQWVVRLDVDVDLATHEILDRDFRAQSVATAPVSETMQAVADHVMQSYAPGALDIVGHVQAPRSTLEIARITAQAALDEFATDAAIVETRTVWQSWESGPLTQQDMANTFKVERERPGTPGFNSFYTVHLNGAALTALRDGSPEGPWAGLFPATIDLAATYSLAVQKRAAFHPDEFLPIGVEFSDAPVFGMEAWEVLDAYARARTAMCLAVDVATALPDCTP
ncbi:MAG: metallophosphoesterase [Sandaracinaceae bacterium]|nr:metallophosphoesterase [Sandaracinaceae bacterium]